MRHEVTIIVYTREDSSTVLDAAIEAAEALAGYLAGYADEQDVSVTWAPDQEEGPA